MTFAAQITGNGAAAGSLSRCARALQRRCGAPSTRTRPHARGLAGFARLLQRHWWRPRLTPLTALLVPFALARRRGGRAPARGGVAGERAGTLPVPVIVVGNVIVGGAGKTPSVIALVALLRGWGWNPGIVSRGHGRDDDTALLLDATTPPEQPPQRPRPSATSPC